MRGAEEGEYAYFLLGGDNLARDVFSRLIKGAWIVVQIAPLATLFAFMVGITLGLPAGYYGGRLDTLLSFLANLILAFPVILLFYLSFGLMGAWVGKRTGSAMAMGLGLGLILGWALGVTFPLFDPGV